MTQLKPASTLLLVLYLVVPSTLAQAQQNGSQTTNSRDRSGGSPAYCAVMGSVSLPGVYEYSIDSPTLAGLIQEAGGLTDEASGTFRIVRAGNASRQMFYNPNGKMDLVSGDIVILDRSPAGGQTQPATYRSGSPGADREQLVQLAVVNLLRRPVVLQIQPQYATLSRVVSLLNQHPNVAAGTKIYLSEDSRFIRQGQQWANSPLSTGCVLFFNPAAVRLDRVPSLPVVYKPKAAGRTSMRSGNTFVVASTNRNSPGAIRLASARQTLDESNPQKVVPIPPWDPQAAGIESETAVDSRTSHSAVQTASHSESSDLTNPPVSAGELPVAPPVPTDTSVKTPVTNQAATAGEKTPSGGESGLWIPLGKGAVQALIVFGCLALLCAGWFLKRKIKPAALPRFEVKTVGQKPKATLDALIENQLPLVEEKFPFPQFLELQARPIREKTFRLDAAHPVPKKPYSTAKPVKSPVAVRPEFEVPVREEVKTPTHSVKISTIEQFTAFASPANWSDTSWDTESHQQPITEIASRPEPQTTAEPTQKIENPQPKPPHFHKRNDRGVLDRVLVTLQGAAWQ